jgi:hypothetical protein
MLTKLGLDDDDDDDDDNVDPKALKVVELRTELEKRGLCSTGLKKVLVERLATWLKGGKGGASTRASVGDASEGNSSTNKESNRSNECNSTNWLDKELVQSPTALNDAIKSGHAPALRTEAQGWDTDCALCDSKALALGTGVLVLQPCVPQHSSVHQGAEHRLR